MGHGNITESTMWVMWDSLLQKEKEG